MIDILKKLFHGDEKYFKHHNSILDENYHLQNRNYQRKKIIKIIPSNKSQQKELFLSLNHENFIYGQLLRATMRHEKHGYENLSEKEMIKKTTEVLEKYTWKAGGYFLNSKLWKQFEKNNDDYEFEDNTVMVFKNSINKVDIDNDETNDFLVLLLNNLNRISCSHKIILNKIPDSRENNIDIELWLIKKTDNDSEDDSLEN